MSKVITDEQELNTSTEELVTEHYALEILGLKNVADFRKFSRSFMKLAEVVKGIENSNNEKLDKGGYTGTAKNLNDEISKKASTAQLGRIKVGKNLTITEDGTLSGNPQYTHPTGAGYNHIPAGGVVGQVLKNNGDGSAEWWTFDIKDKLNKGSLPATIPDAKGIYDLLENNGGLNIDPNLLYLNDAGTKTAGKVYFDKNKKGLFECRQTTTSTVNSTDYFVDISNKASSDRLDNLCEIIFVDYGVSYKYTNGILIYSLCGVFELNKYYYFKIPFLNNNYSLVGTHNASESTLYHIGFGNKTNSSFKIYGNTSAISRITIGIIAIGQWK